jgi:hypothetical protein
MDALSEKIELAERWLKEHASGDERVDIYKLILGLGC